MKVNARWCAELLAVLCAALVGCSADVPSAYGVGDGPSNAGAPRTTEPLVTQPHASPMKSDYIRAPGGHFVASTSVREVPSHAHIAANGDVIVGEKLVDHLDRRAPAPSPAPAPRASVHSRRPDAASPPALLAREGARAPAPIAPPDTSSWIEVEWANPPPDGVHWYNGLEVDFVVPDLPTTPSSVDGQLLYLWPGLVSTDGPVLQPVLQYGSNNVYGGDYWLVSSWYFHCFGCTDNMHSPPVQVNPGDTIHGAVWVDVNSPNCSNSGVGCDWYVAYIVNNNQFGDAILVNVPYVFNVAEYGVLETGSPGEGMFGTSLGAKQCSDFPPLGYAWFVAKAVYDPLPNWNNFNLLPYVPMSWVSQGQSPACGYGTLLWPFDNTIIVLEF